MLKLLDGAQERYKFFAVRRQRMVDLATFVLFVHKTGRIETAKMFSHGLEVRLKLLRDFFQAQIRLFSKEEHCIDPPMVGNSFEVSLNLLRGFHVYFILQHYDIIANVIMLLC